MVWAFGKIYLKAILKNRAESASEEELSAAYEIERKKWMREGFNGGTGEKTFKMKN